MAIDTHIPAGQLPQTPALPDGGPARGHTIRGQAARAAPPGSGGVR
jgi:hypothetical protein